jgi:hypothetical protein
MKHAISVVRSTSAKSLICENFDNEQSGIYNRYTLIIKIIAKVNATAIMSSINKNNLIRYKEIDIPDAVSRLNDDSFD